MHDLIRVFWYGHDGSFFTLSGDRVGQGVTLQSVGGLVSSVSRTLVGRPNAVGVDSQGYVIDSMSGSLTVVVTADKLAHKTLPEVWRQWLNSWSTQHPGKLVVNVLGETWSVGAVAEKNVTAPDRSPYSPLSQHVVSSVDVLTLDGIWSGETRSYSGATVQVGNAGTVDLHPVVVWSGSGQSVTLPDSRVIALPTVTGKHRMTLNPGDGFKVWGPDGEDAVNVWAAFRGRDVRAPIAPGQYRQFGLTSGVAIEATPLHENPWR